MPLHMETQHDKTTHHAATRLRPRTLCRPLGMQQASKHEQNTEKLYMQKASLFMATSSMKRIPKCWPPPRPTKLSSPCHRPHWNKSNPDLLSTSHPPTLASVLTPSPPRSRRGRCCKKAIRFGLAQCRHSIRTLKHSAIPQDH